MSVQPSKRGIHVYNEFGHVILLAFAPIISEQLLRWPILAKSSVTQLTQSQRAVVDALPAADAEREAVAALLSDVALDSGVNLARPGRARAS
jgi:hypothetical protein